MTALTTAHDEWSRYKPFWHLIHQLLLLCMFFYDKNPIFPQPWKIWLFWSQNLGWGLGEIMCSWLQAQHHKPFALHIQQTPTLYNHLPLHIQQAPTLSMFKAWLKTEEILGIWLLIQYKSYLVSWCRMCLSSMICTVLCVNLDCLKCAIEINWTWTSDGSQALWQSTPSGDSS